MQRLLVMVLLISCAQAQKFYVDAQVGLGTDFSAAAGGLRFEADGDWGLRVYGGGVGRSLMGGFEGVGFAADAYKLLSASPFVDTYAGIGVGIADGTGIVGKGDCSVFCTFPRGPASAWMGYGILGARLGIFRLELLPYYRSVTVQGGTTETRGGLYTALSLTVLLNP